jgi:hypothetical protein
MVLCCKLLIIIDLCEIKVFQRYKKNHASSICFVAVGFIPTAWGFVAVGENPPQWSRLCVCMVLCCKLLIIIDL